MIRESMHRFILGLCVCVCGALIACQPVYDEEEDTSKAAATQSLKVLARASGESNLLYPAYVYAFKENGEYAACQLMTGPDTPIDLKLDPAAYTIVAVAGINDEYVVPEKPKLTDVIRMKEGNRSGRSLMMGRATVTVKSGTQTKNSVTVTLYNVVSLVNVTLEGIPAEVKRISLQLSPLCSTLAFNGEYGGTGQAVDLVCSPEVDGVWGSDPFYIFPGSASQTIFTIAMEDEEGVHTYGYTFQGRPQANVPFNVGGSYLGDVTLEGTLVPSDWERPVEVRFEFGASEQQPGSTPDDPELPLSPDETGLPAIGTLWKDGIVIGHTSASSHEPAQVLLLGLQEWTTMLDKFEETLEGQLTEGWRLLTSEEAHALKEAFSGEVLAAVNQRIAQSDASLPLLDLEMRYLYDQQGTLFAFGFKKSSKFLVAGKTKKYKVRLVRSLPFTD